MASCDHGMHPGCVCVCDIQTNKYNKKKVLLRRMQPAPLFTVLLFKEIPQQRKVSPLLFTPRRVGPGGVRS